MHRAALREISTPEGIGPLSEPAVFVVIRDQERRFYYDRWAHVFLFRNLVWGPDALDEWLSGEEVQEDDEEDWFAESSGGAVIDHDRRRLVWDGDDHDLSVARVGKVLHELLRAAWPGYEVEYASRGITDLAIAAGVDVSEEGLIETDDDELEDRPSTVREAAGFYDDDEPDEGDDEDLDDDDDLEEGGRDEMDDETTRAWVTLINEQGVVRHRQLDEISQDIIRGEKAAIRQLIELGAGDVPAEAVVTEGIWFDFGRREIGYWGNNAARRTLEPLRRGWRGWDIAWAEEGYSDQCRVSGPSGIPMSDAEALAKLTPKILSTKRIDLGSVLAMFGGKVKRTAVKATGCLTVILCIPVLLFGLIAGKMQAAMITILIVCVAVAIVFKLIERKFKRKFNDGPIGMHARQQGESGTRAPVAGPLDPTERRTRLEELLLAAGMPSLSEIEVHVSEDEEALSELL
ncbi:putative membrane protein [Rhodopirellula sp. SWK7]|nr:putative membrane protein [Rhodopirellula sp. SWK7]